METNPGEVTQLLKTMSRGDRKAAEALFALIYAELHPLVRAYMRPKRPDHTLQVTALINEALSPLST